MQYHAELGQDPEKIKAAKEEVIIDQFGPQFSLVSTYSEYDSNLDWFNTSLGDMFLKMLRQDMISFD